jgi:hypothetical protein
MANSIRKRSEIDPTAGSPAVAQKQKVDRARPGKPSLTRWRVLCSTPRTATRHRGSNSGS